MHITVNVVIKNVLPTPTGYWLIKSEKFIFLIYKSIKESMSVAKLSLTFALRDIKFRKFISILNIIAIASGIATFMALRSISFGCRIAAENVVSQVLPGEILVYGEGLCDLPEEIVQDFENVPGVQRAVPVVLTMGYMEGALTFILGIESKDLDLAVTEYSSGGRFNEKDYRVVIVETNFAESRNISVGKTVFIKPQISPNSYPFRVVGVADIGMKIQEISSTGTYVIIPLREAQEIMGKESFVTMAMLKLDEDRDPSLVEKSIKEEFPEAKIFRREDILKIVYQVISLIDGLLLSATVIGVIIAVFGTVNTIMANVREHAREIAIMRALGARVSHIATIFLTEAFIYGVIGGVIGLALGFLETSLIRNLINSMGFFEIPMITEPGITLLSFSSSIIVSLLSAVYPTIKACNVKPVEVLKYE